VKPTWPLAFAAAAAVAVLSALLARRWHAWRQAAVAGARARHGLAAEERAAELLDQRGFEVLDGRPSARWTVVRDGVVHEVTLRGDYLVQRRGRRYLAEVKTGDGADVFGNAATRRQLLEYLMAFDVDGVLLVCPQARAVHRIELPGATRPRRSALPLVVVALAVGGALGYASAITAW
jgi:hypothetical protein